MPAPLRKRKSSRQPTDTRSDRRAPVLQVIAQIPVGFVATYGQIAALAGMPGAARYVGYCLRELPKGSKLPWQRVIGAGGRIAFPAGSDAFLLQTKKLRSEGVECNDGRVNLHNFQWDAGIADD
jgi:methylated-DNA-protein-cysteine methyltransferase-like protein